MDFRPPIPETKVLAIASHVGSSVSVIFVAD